MKRLAYPTLLAALVLGILLPLGFHGLWIPDETRNAQIAQAMLRSGDWLSPHLLGLRYFEKPTGGYWLIAASQAVFGENLFGARFASALVTALSTLLVLWVARRLWSDPRRTWAAGLLYASFGLIIGQAGYANLDPQFTLWANLSLAALWFAFDAATPRTRAIAWSLLGAACAFGFMTKGFLAFLLPVIVGVPYALLHRRFLELLRYGPLAVLVAVLASLPWALMIHAREPDFWNFFFWHEHIRRFAGEDAQHGRPFWFFVPLLFAGALPWAVLVVPALRKGFVRLRDPRLGFLLLWFAMPFLFFSLAKGKLPTYIMPCFAPLALLMADSLADALQRSRQRVLHLNGALNLLLGLVALVALVVLQLRHPLYRGETPSVLLVGIVCVAWLVCGALQLMRPAQLWAAPAFALWILVALVPTAMPNRLVNSKMPDQFVLEHLDELRAAHSLLSNDLGAATALGWRTGRSDVNLLNTVGELKYGLGYPEGAGRSISLDEAQAWIARARAEGSVGVLLRVNGTSDEHDLAQMPKDAISYRQNHLVVLLIPKAAP
ncbi:4-amino-4-deoxy-L-arabinose transferase [Pseudomonas sp. ATCC 13867]|uniref:lipid IV(A) 4-amino-4-deoxy-L-arabinosyltransferase n=1 Tax=Pseudomonas sp. ATCC 13867 TaxID=1294143 RepID=UPI0002C4E829|nr:lipid IV(A) 4-amino-4-deoxy-L-arabinosyltransferase [Pseudomonas sp. ATCC 13867]AGI22886.1 4-amino-4-deoxy-L-arabinose transferase [Pseudomonas sp. ATCC 13867]RFQ36071.1 lipid IV(A) 4-amino-4-deoxy-L-arabinosyltransferase [Pseudomonas sp. ATCC 13867]